MLAYFLTFLLATTSAPERMMVITIDDLPVNTTQRDLTVKRQVTLELVAALSEHDVPALGFVNESKLEQDGKVADVELALLRIWLENGLELGNHGYSHLDLHRVELEAYLEDIKLGARQTPSLAREAGLPYRYFRHPFLHTGMSAEDRDAVLTTLNSLGLQVAPVTVDNGEWIYARAYDVALDRGDLRLALRVRQSYLTYMEDMVAYYEAQSQALLGYELPQVMLLHANRLNAAMLPQLLEQWRERGYRFGSMSEALEDPAYKLPDEYFGRGGITWLHRWALTQKKSGSFFAGEPDVPDFIKQASELNL